LGQRQKKRFRRRGKYSELVGDPLFGFLLVLLGDGETHKVLFLVLCLFLLPAVVFVQFLALRIGWVRNVK